MAKTSNARFHQIYSIAYAAGMAALNAAKPTPMGVVEADIYGNPLPNGRSYCVSEGACGFAWVTIRPGNCAFANWLKRNQYARRGYGGGVQIWVSEGGQSMQRKEAFAAAFRGVLNEFQEELGFKSAYSGSRMD